MKQHQNLQQAQFNERISDLNANEAMIQNAAINNVLKLKELNE